MLKTQVIVCLLNFLVAAIMGLVLRYVAIGDIEINYRFLTHAHSHIAMLGWVYLMLYAFIVHYLVTEQKPIYNKLFWLTQFSVLGMMFSFPFQGYAAISITFSTLHILCSYYFVYLIWKKHTTNSIVTTLLLRSALLFMLLSTLGVWCLGPAVGLLGKASAFYQIAIQFFLHFQFNGWFLFAVIALLFRFLEIRDSKLFRLFFKLLIASIVLTLALPVQWFLPHKFLMVINAIGVSLQLIAIIYGFRLAKPQLKEFQKSSSKLVSYCLKFAILNFVIKTLLQMTSIIPEFAEELYLHRNLVIGFVHLLMLGVISGFLFALIMKNQQETINKTLWFGFVSFITGFTLTETILLIQGILFYNGSGMLPHYDLILFISSIFLPLGILFILFSAIKHNTNATQTSKAT